MANDQRTQHYGPDVLQQLSEDADGMAELRRTYPWAADEIERLRDDLEQATRHRDTAREQLQREREANATLRAALELFLDLDRIDCQGDALEDVFPDLFQNARAALAGSVESEGMEGNQRELEVSASAPADARLAIAERLLREVAEETAPQTQRLMGSAWGERCREWLAGKTVPYARYPEPASASRDAVEKLLAYILDSDDDGGDGVFEETVERLARAARASHQQEPSL